MLLRIAAAFMFFTRLPLYKVVTVPSDYFKDLTHYWALTGWLTASVMAITLYISAQFLPLSIAVILAIVSRLLLTRALHEDGLADFFDGFGGGGTKERILVIMKDSHSGSFGVIALIIYFLLFHQTIYALPLKLACFALLAGDPLAKFIASLITFRLPYARKEEESKIKIIYNKMSVGIVIFSAVTGLLPLVLLFPPPYWFACILPILMFIGLTALMQKRIQGYTGDCCGALCLLIELSFYLSIAGLYTYYGPLFYSPYFS
ncbi:adenosylcobinamide-GDP ribazoletransferase [Neisseria sp. Ec49-e6-T10]|uniref:adenosylcobinamide-GDP ribazoletransferase n=1 Tax=Neisseria sp. Ec49-e6-T10 TaxID=3140744 RepID=UPI003EBD9035